MTLAAGALGISIAFIHNVASRPVQVAWLGAAWVLFSLSLLLILVSFLTSQLALRKEIAWIDSGRPEGDNTSGNAGRWTVILNCLAALALIAGVGCLVVFALYNLEGR
ncbi:MAG: hypothetical protein KatS3mg014_1087 [Actinomycetota bacterium]|nr:MAG: hypothetical protein KatS3mg014_1087 [Actinomycetota bacterium]